MLGLPAHPGRYGALFIVLGLLAAAVLAPFVWRSLRRSLPLAESVLLAVSLLSTVAAAPFLAWRIVEDVRYTSRLTHPQAERIGGDMQHIDHRAIDRLRALIPPGATFYVTAPASVAPSARRGVTYWTGYALQPRIRVRDPAHADWIVGWNRDPRTAARVDRVVRVSPPGPGDVFLLGHAAS